MLRTTVACLAAGVGGADAVTVLPFDHALGLPDAFARRIARNTQTILHGGGAPGPGDRPGRRLLVRGAAHRRTRPTRPGRCSRRSSGPAARRAALRSGLIAERTRRDLGSAHARTSPGAASRSPASASSPTSPSSRWSASRRPAPDRRGGLPRVRRDEAFEALRARSDAHLAATGARPRVFLAALGPAAAHTARVDLRRQPVPGGRHRDAVSEAGAPVRRGRHGWPRRSRPAAHGRPACAPATRCTPSRRAAVAAALKAAGARRRAAWPAPATGTRYPGRSRRLRLRRLRRGRRAVRGPRPMGVA